MSEAASSDVTKKTGGGLRVAVLFLAVVLLAAGVGLMLAAPFLFRAGLIDLGMAMGGLQQVVLWCALVATALGLVGLVLSFLGAKHRAGIVAVLVSAGAGMVAGSLYGNTISREDLPPIHDVQTDWSLPVAFTEATLKAREAAGAVRVRDDAMTGEGQGRWSHMLFRDAQAAFYDDVKPLSVQARPADVTRAAAKAAERLGWEVTLSDPESGVVEAVYRSPWYELVHDIAVRVTPGGSGSRVDVRAVSRNAGHDMGVNASLVKQMLSETLLAL